MVDVHDDLAWDYTTDSLESSPLLNDNNRAGHSSFFNFSKDASYRVTKRQAEYLLQNLEDGAAFMRSYILAETSPMPIHQRHSKCKNFISKLGNHSLIVTFILQALSCVVLILLDLVTSKEKEVAATAGTVCMVLIQVLNFLLIVYVSAKLTRQLVIKNISGVFLIQSYLSTLLLFAGIYTASFRLYRKGWKFVDESGNEPIHIIVVFVRMLYLSISTGTLCGNAVITPRAWFNYLFQAIEMLTCFLYFASILSQIYASQSTIPHVREEQFVQLPRRRRPSITSLASVGGHYGTLDSTRIDGT